MLLCVRVYALWSMAIDKCPELVKKMYFLLARLESAYSLIWGSHEIWGKGGGDTLPFL